MARITAVANVKGGVGKTSVVINLGHTLAAAGAQILLIDTDVQGAVASWLGVSAPHSLADALDERVDPRAAVVVARPNLSVLASGQAALRHTIGVLLGRVANRKVNPIFRRMDRVLASLEHAYDYILIDCAPSLDFVMEAVYPAINDVLIPTSLTGPSIENMEVQLDTLEEMRDRGYDVSLSLIVPTLVRQDEPKQARWLAHLQQHYGSLVAGPIPYDAILEDQNLRQQTVVELDHPAVRAAYADLAIRYKAHTSA